MSALDDLTENSVRPQFTGVIWQRALLLQSQVSNAVRSGDDLNADVMGARSYSVAITVDGISLEGECTCAQSGAGLCMHVGATLLRWLRAPETFTVINAAPSPAALALVMKDDAPEPFYGVPSAPFWIHNARQDERTNYLRELREALDAMTVVTLREIVAERGWTVRGTQKAAIIDQMAAFMADPAQIAVGVAALSPKERQLLAITAVAGNWLARDAAARFGALLGEFGKAPTARTIAGILVQLGRAGLLITSHLARESSTDASHVPVALWSGMPPLLAELIPGTAELPDGVAPDGVRLSRGRQIVNAATQLLLLLEHSSSNRAARHPRPVLEVSSMRWLKEWEYDPTELAQLVARRKTSRVDQTLIVRVPPPPRSLDDEQLRQSAYLLDSVWGVDLLVRLLEYAGLILPGSPLRIDPEAKGRFLQRTPAEQHAILFDAYVAIEHWQELWEIMRVTPNLRMQRVAYAGEYDSGSTAQAVRHRMQELRALFLQTLSFLPEDRWIAVDRIASLLFRVVPIFSYLWVDGSYYGYGNIGRAGNWYFTWDTRTLGDQFDDWQRLQGRVLALMLGGPLFWLGLVDLRVTKDGAITHVRMHGLADLYRRQLASIEVDRPDVAGAAPLPTPIVGVQEAPGFDGQVIHLRTLSGQSVTLLDQIGRVDPVPPGAKAQSRIAYRPDAVQVQRAFEAGATPDALEVTWQATFGAPMPAALRTRLDEWWGVYGDLRFYRNVTLLELADDYALAEIKAVTTLNQLMVAELSPRLVLVPASAVSTLAAELKKAGYTPKQTDSTT